MAEMDFRELLKRSLVRIHELEAKLKEQEAPRDEAVAIVGIGCRFPGNIGDPASFWEFLNARGDAIRSVVPRWTALGYVPAGGPSQWGGQWAGLLADESIAAFDAEFFGITPREAAAMDPQQRMLLEVTLEALEDAGIAPPRLSQTRSGVFIGILDLDYKQSVNNCEPSESDAYNITGNLASVAAGRISYVLNLQGPCLTIDTACSSSLVAVHEACRSLAQGECDFALAGGAHLILSPHTFALYKHLQAMSADGRCRAFDAAANGMVRAEGVGIVALKRLSDAQRDGNHIWAVIRGTAVNHDGRSVGLTAPNGLAQQAVMKEALRRARVQPSEVGYVEAHGTGTSLGDPIEADALRAIFGRPRDDGAPCVIGSVKTNLGHTEGAAGIAGLIKTALILNHDHIPPQLHFQNLNPRIRIENTRLAFTNKQTSWPKGARGRIAGVSSFGISGTNAHAVLEEPPARFPSHDRANQRSYNILPLSARNAAALQALVSSYHSYLQAAAQKEDDLRFADVCYGASVGRAHHERRCAVVKPSAADAAVALGAYLQDGAADELIKSEYPLVESPRPVFVFSGQGAQWLGMGQQLLAEGGVFRNRIEECDRLILRHGGWSLLEELGRSGEAARLHETAIAQAALFAVQLGLCDLFAAWGVVPSAVIGHSIGEYAAAVSAKIMDTDTAIRLICRRGELMERIAGQGKMLAVSLGPAHVCRYLAECEEDVSIAAVNDPHSVVLSGETTALEGVAERLQQDGVQSRLVRVGYAFHSPQLDPLRAEFLAGCQFTASSPDIPMYSTVLGRLLRVEDLDRAYWWRNMREPVRLSAALEAAVADNGNLFVEISPHPVLSGHIAQCLAFQGKEDRVIFTLKRKCEERRSLLEALARLYVNGYPVDWMRLFSTGGSWVSLPKYPWQHGRYWINRTEQQGLGRTADTGSGWRRPLLGPPIRSSIHPSECYWQQDLDEHTLPFLRDHRLGDTVVMPGAAFVEMLLAASAELADPDSCSLADVRFERMLPLVAGRTTRTQVAFSAEAPGHPNLQLVSEDAEAPGTWYRHAAAVRVRQPESCPAREDLVELARRCSATLMSSAEHYRDAASRGVRLGASFQALESLQLGDGEALARATLPDSAFAPEAVFQIHPVLLDAALQLLFRLLMRGRRLDDLGGTYVPVFIKSIRIYRRASRTLWAVARCQAAAPGQSVSLTGSVSLCDDDGRLFATLEGVGIQKVSPLLLPASADTALERCYYALEWKKARDAEPAPAASRLPNRWLLFADRSGVGLQLQAQLRSLGKKAALVRTGPQFRCVGPDAFEIDPADPDDYRKVVAESALCAGETAAVVHLFSLDSTPAGKTSAESLIHDQTRSSLSVLLLSQVLVSLSPKSMPRLVLVTRGAQPAGDAPLAIAESQAPLWGLARTVALEHPELGCKRIDLPPRPEVESEAESESESVAEAQWLVRELAAEPDEPQSALRREGRYVARLVHTSPGSAAGKPLQRIGGDRTYLITGGLGGLGLKLARWLVAGGARHLVLVGRTAPTERAQAELQAMTQAGAQVLALPADVSRRDEMDRVFKQIRATLPPLAGVVHAAAVLDDHPILQLSRDAFLRVLLPKMLGAWHLDALTRDMELDFFVLYSSAASLLGSAGQGNYTAGNAFVDALAWARRRAGRPALSVQWGSFSQVGMAAAAANRGARLADRGIDSLTPEQGLNALARLLGCPLPAVGVLKLDIRKWHKYCPQQRGSPTWSELEPEDAAQPQRHEPSRLVATLRRAGTTERRQLAADYVCDKVAAAFRSDPARIDRNVSLMALGMDSLMSLELRNRLEADLGIKLPSTLFLNYPTINTAAGHLIEHLEPEVGAEIDPTSAAKEAAAGESIADDELLAALDRTVDRVRKERLR